MKKTLSLFLTGTFVAAVGTVSAQLAPAPQQGRQSAPPQQQTQIRQAPQGQPAQQQAQDTTQIQAKLEELHRELEKVSVRLNDIHQEALLEEDVREMMVDYEKGLSEKILESAPDLEEQVTEHKKVLEKLSDLGGDAEKPEIEALLTEHGALKQQLAPIENQLLNDTEVREARMEYQEELIAAMNEVNPEVEEIIEERMTLAQNMMAIQQQYLQSQQSRAPQSGQGQAPATRQSPQRPN